MTTKKTKSTSLRALPVPFEAEGYLEGARIRREYGWSPSRDSPAARLSLHPGRDKNRAFDNLRLKELGGVPYLPGRGRLLILPTTSTTIGTPSISGGNSTPPAGCSLRFIFTA